MASDLWPQRSELQEVAPRVFITNTFGAKSAAKLRAAGITHVLVCAAELEVPHHPMVVYHRLHLADNTHEPLPLDEAFAFIDTALAVPHGRVLLHCAAGSSRSGAVAVAHIMRLHGWTCEQALQHATSVRPLIQPNPGFMEASALFLLFLSPLLTPSSSSYNNCSPSRRHWSNTWCTSSTLGYEGSQRPSCATVRGVWRTATVVTRRPSVVNDSDCSM